MPLIIKDGKTVTVTWKEFYAQQGGKPPPAPEQGTLGTITPTPPPAAPRPGPSPIQYGPGPVAPPQTIVPPGATQGEQLSNVRASQGFAFAGTLGLQQPAPVITPTAPSRFASPGQAQAMRAQGTVPSTVIFPATIQPPSSAAQTPAPPTGTLGLGAPPATGTSFGQGPNQIVTGQDLRFRTLNNPRTIGEFIAVGALPNLQAWRDALERGEEIPDVVKRFFLNQGVIEEDEFGISFPLDDLGGYGLGGSGPSYGYGGGGGGGGGGGYYTQYPGGRYPGASNISIGLVNWRI